MPVDPRILGFSNVWYPSGLLNATVHHAADGAVRILDAVHFVATKLEAFASRGEENLFHHDLEDIVAIVDGRAELLEELASAENDVRTFIAEEFSRFVARDDFLEALPGHVRGDSASQQRVPLIVSRMQRIASLASAATAPVDGPRPPQETATVSSTHLAPLFQWGAPRRLPGAAALAPASTPSRWAILRSSNLRSAAYDPATSTLLIEFHGSRMYAYAGVPRTIFEGLLKSGSPGRYHHQWIRGRFDDRKV